MTTEQQSVIDLIKSENIEDKILGVIIAGKKGKEFIQSLVEPRYHSINTGGIIQFDQNNEDVRIFLFMGFYLYLGCSGLLFFNGEPNHYDLKHVFYTEEYE
jgi:hypothetical protein